MREVPIRLAQPDDIGPLADLWHEMWQQAHAHLVQAALTELRTRQSFFNRLSDMGDALRMTGPMGAPLGFCSIKTDQIDQLYVSEDAKGTGLAPTLLADGEDRLRAAGTVTAFLDCAIGNDRAARFYQKQGWTLQGKDKATLDTSEGPFEMTTLVFTKAL